MTLTTAEIIQYLKLEPHIEGGYFRETYRSQENLATPREGNQRQLLTSIYYLLTSDRPIDYLHRNQSPIMHYFQGGNAITYHLLSPEGEWQTVKLGLDLRAGEIPQLLVPEGYWKTAVLERGDFGLIGEAVAPGFDYRDLEIATPDKLQSLYPQHWQKIKPFLNPRQLDESLESHD